MFKKLGAPCPNVDFDEVQQQFYATPEVLERSFKLTHWETINSKCIKELNAVLYCMYTKFNQPQFTHYEAYDKTSQLLDVTVSFNCEPDSDNLVFTLSGIFVRPCFMGQGMFIIWTYQLLCLAWHLRYMDKIVVYSCTPTTANILLLKFGGEVFVYLTTGKDINKKPNCILYDLDDMKEKFTTETLGIANKIKRAHNWLITLREEAFPTLDQLNYPKWVHDSFKHRPAPT
jgi:hypothetical protein